MVKLSVEEILGVLSRTLRLEVKQFSEKKRKSALRPLAAKMLSKYGGLTNRKIADILNIGTGAAAGRTITRLNDILENNHKLKVLLLYYWKLKRN